MEIHNCVLRAQTAPQEWDLLVYALEGSDPAAAQTGSGLVHWADGDAVTPVYSQALLRAGNRYTGPGIVEASYTTVVVEPGFSLSRSTST